jgi:hypothetical protein
LSSFIRRINASATNSAVPAESNSSTVNFYVTKDRYGMLYKRSLDSGPVQKLCEESRHSWDPGFCRSTRLCARDHKQCGGMARCTKWLFWFYIPKSP